MAHWESRHPNKKPWSLGNAAELGQLLVVRCNLCRRTVYFLASDLLEFFDDMRPAHRPPFACSKCRTMEFMHVKVRSPEPGDWGNLPVRRPAEVVRIQKWRTVKLGDEVKPPATLTFEQHQEREAKAFLEAERRAYKLPKDVGPTEV